MRQGIEQSRRPNLSVYIWIRGRRAVAGGTVDTVHLSRQGYVFEVLEIHEALRTTGRYQVSHLLWCSQHMVPATGRGAVWHRLNFGERANAGTW